MRARASQAAAASSSQHTQKSLARRKHAAAAQCHKAWASPQAGRADGTVPSLAGNPLWSRPAHRLQCPWGHCPRRAGSCHSNRECNRSLRCTSVGCSWTTGHPPTGWLHIMGAAQSHASTPTCTDTAQNNTAVMRARVLAQNAHASAHRSVLVRALPALKNRCKAAAASPAVLLRACKPA